MLNGQNNQNIYALKQDAHQTKAQNKSIGLLNESKCKDWLKW